MGALREDVTISAWIRLKMRNVSDFVQKLKTHISCSITVFRKLCRLWDDAEKCGGALYVLDNKGYTRASTRTHPCIRSSTHAHIYASAHTHTHTSMHPRIHTRTHPCIRASTHAHIHASAHPHTHTSMHPRIHTCTHKYVILVAFPR